MALDSDTKDAIQGTALAVVESQQKVVGGALVGGGASVLAEKTDSQSGILEQLRELTVKSVRGIKDVADKLGQMLSFDKDEARRLREAETEKLKEADGDRIPEITDDEGGDVGKKDAEEATGKLAALSTFMMGLPGVAQLSKIFKPMLAFFGKSGALFKIFGRFGPLAGLTLAVGFVIRYMDDIVKALAPVLDALKQLGVALKPVFDEIMKVVDIVVKGALISIGHSLRIVIATIELAFMTFLNSLKFMKDLIWGLITGDLELIKSAFTNLFAGFQEIGDKFIGAILGAFKDMINGIGEIFGFENLIESTRVFFMETIPNFFNEAIENFKIEIQKDIDFIMGRFGEIFDAIGETFTNTVDGVKNFFVSLPGKIMDGVKSLFAPVIDFFNSVGNRIKEAINGIIESLPLPQFVKDKMKFETSETAPGLDTAGTGDASIAEKIASDERAGIETIGGEVFKDGVMQMNGENFGSIGPGMAESIAEKIGDAVKVAYDTDKKRYVVVKADTPLKPSNFKVIGESPDGGVEFGDVETAKSPNINSKNIGPAKESVVPITVVNNNSPVSTQTNAATNSTHTGKLDTGVDSYHDRHAFVA